MKCLVRTKSQDIGIRKFLKKIFAAPERQAPSVHLKALSILPLIPTRNRNFPFLEELPFHPLLKLGLLQISGYQFLCLFCLFGLRVSPDETCPYPLSQVIILSALCALASDDV